MNLNSKRQDSIVTRKLCRDGVTFQGVWYNSPALQNLRDQLPPLAEVTLRFDPIDVRHVYVRDRAREQWIECFLSAGPRDTSPTS